MKKMIIWLIVMIVVIGAVFGGIAWWATISNHRINLNQMKVTKLQQQTVRANAQIDHLAINVRTAVISIKEGPQFKVQADNVAPGEYQISQLGEKMTIKQTQAEKHQIEFGHSASITITVPSALKNVQITQLNGTLNITNLSTNRLIVKHLNGTTTMHGVTITRSGILDKKNGATTLKQMTIPGLKMMVKTGQGKLNGKKVSGNGQEYTDHNAHQLVINSKNGQVDVTTE